MPTAVVDAVQIRLEYVQVLEHQHKTGRLVVVLVQQGHHPQHHRAQVWPQPQSRVQLQQVVLLSTPQEQRMSVMEKLYSSSEGNASVLLIVRLHVVLDHLVSVQGWELNSKLARLAAALCPEFHLEVYPPLSLPQLHPRLPQLQIL
jgi:hypothetical protein